MTLNQIARLPFYSTPSSVRHNCLAKLSYELKISRRLNLWFEVKNTFDLVTKVSNGNLVSCSKVFWSTVNVNFGHLVKTFKKPFEAFWSTEKEDFQSTDLHMGQQIKSLINWPKFQNLSIYSKKYFGSTDSIQLNLISLSALLDNSNYRRASMTA